MDGFELAVPIDKILQMMGMCRAKFDKEYRDDMMQSGAIFKIKKGRPPRIYIMGFPSRIKQYIALQASEGKTL